MLTKLNRDLTTTDWSFNVFDISNTFYGGNLVDNSTFYFVKEPMISLDGYVYVTCANKLLTEYGIRGVLYAFKMACSNSLRGAKKVNRFNATATSKRCLRDRVIRAFAASW